MDFNEFVNVMGAEPNSFSDLSQRDSIASWNSLLFMVTMVCAMSSVAVSGCWLQLEVYVQPARNPMVCAK